MNWITQGTLSIDSATCAFADPAGVPQSFEMPVSDMDVIDVTGQGIPLIACNTKEDLEMPLEVAHDRRAASLEFVNDVAELEGLWHEVGQLEISSVRCMACDPYGLHSPFYRIEFSLDAGTYVAEVFEFRGYDEGNDVLGFRIRRR